MTKYVRTMLSLRLLTSNEKYVKKAKTLILDPSRHIGTTMQKAWIFLGL